MPTPFDWSATRDSTLSGIAWVDALIDGVQWSSNTVTFSFPTETSTWSTNPFTGYDEIREVADQGDDTVVSGVDFALSGGVEKICNFSAPFPSMAPVMN
jgi:hypothetical protein